MSLTPAETWCALTLLAPLIVLLAHAADRLLSLARVRLTGTCQSESDRS